MRPSLINPLRIVIILNKKQQNHILTYEKGKHSQTDIWIWVSDRQPPGYMYAKLPFQ